MPQNIDLHLGSDSIPQKMVTFDSFFKIHLLHDIKLMITWT